MCTKNYQIWLYGVSKKQLENVAVGNALKLQFEAARRRADSIHFNFVARAKIEVAQPVRCRLIAFYSCWYVTLWPWNLTRWPWPWHLTLNICTVPAVLWSNSVPAQSLAELLQFEYVTLWPWTCIRVALCSGIVCTKFKLSQAIHSSN